MIAKRTSDEQLKKRLEQALRENMKKRRSQKRLRDLSVPQEDDNAELSNNSADDHQLLCKSAS